MNLFQGEGCFLKTFFNFVVFFLGRPKWFSRLSQSTRRTLLCENFCAPSLKFSITDVLEQFLEIFHQLNRVFSGRLPFKISDKIGQTKKMSWNSSKRMRTLWKSLAFRVERGRPLVTRLNCWKNDEIESYTVWKIISEYCDFMLSLSSTLTVGRDIFKCNLLSSWLEYGQGVSGFFSRAVLSRPN